MSETNDTIPDLTEAALIGGSLIGRAGPRLRGPAGFAGDAARGAMDLAATGRVSGNTMAGTAASAATMVGARLIPGVGWALLAYGAADVGSRAILGKPFGETWVGQPIDWAAGKAGRGAVGLATAAFDAVGWTSGSDFMKNTLSPWAFGKDDPSPGFVRGPEAAMSKDDWYEHPPVKIRDTAIDSTSLTQIEPNSEEIAARREKVLAQDTLAIERDTVASELGIEGGTTRSDVLKRALEMIESEAKEKPFAPQRKNQGREIDE